MAFRVVAGKKSGATAPTLKKKLFVTPQLKFLAPHTNLLSHLITHKHKVKMGDKIGVGLPKRNNNSSLMIDSKFLNCHTCANPLDIPVFQCAIPHYVCSKCSTANGRKCSCSRKLTNCSLLGAILQSATVSCPYSTLGCCVEIPYSKKHAHESSCPFDPNCFCPIVNCNFKCTSNLLSSHIKSEHSECYINARYGIEFVCLVPKTPVMFHVIIGEDGRSFLLKRGYNGPGASVSLVCMGSESIAEDLCYEISLAINTDSEDIVWSMKSSQMICIRKYVTNPIYPARPICRSFLLPFEAYAEMKEMEFKICISKK